MDSKLDDLLYEYDMDLDEFLEEFGLESIVPGICRNPDCNATYEYEPDQKAGWCDCCHTTSVVSGLILAGIM